MRPKLFALIALIALPVLVLGGQTTSEAASNNGLRIEVLVDGMPLREYYARGTTYIEARQNRNYAVRLTNLEGVRQAVALSVDGRNSIDAKRTSAKDAAKWVLDPYQSVVIRGWQTSQSTAHRFVFTTEEKSYAGWLGDSSNLGVIEAVAFREIPRPVVRYAPPEPEPYYGERYGYDYDRRREVPAPRSSNPSMDAAEESAAGYGKGAGARGSDSSTAQAEAQAPRADGALGGLSSTDSASGRKKAKGHAPRDYRPQKEDSLAATGFGNATNHRVSEVAMQIEQHPSSSVRLRYEYQNALIRLGVLPDNDPLARRERSGGFSDSQFAPVP